MVAEYEALNYNKDIYRGSLYSADLCVASGDVAIEGAADENNVPIEGATEADNIATAGAMETDILSAALFDISDARTDYAYHVHDRVYPASLTKLMTALVTLENADLSETVTVSANADSGNFAIDEQTCGIKAGDKMTLEELLYGLLIYSGNDNAVAIAEHIGGSIEGFAQMMNAKAQDIMATNSHFVNPNGLHNDEHYTTAYDMYLIFNECLKYDKFKEIIQSDSYKTSVKGADGQTRIFEWEPTNLYALGVVKLPKSGKIIGGKTGTTKKAGNCLILLDESNDGKSYISVVMGAETKELLYQDMTELIEKIP